jgi:hypothetical protein
MDTLLHADIFFFVTTIAVVVFTIALTVLIVYLVQLCRSLRKIADAVDEEVILVRQDMNDLRNGIRKRGEQASTAISWIGQLFGVNNKSRSKKKSKKE